MEGNDGLIRKYHEFVNKRNDKMKEYHVDIPQKLYNQRLTLSVQRMQSRPIIIVGQD